MAGMEKLVIENGAPTQMVRGYCVLASAGNELWKLPCSCLHLPRRENDENK